MAIENETADQVVRMVLQGSEVVLKLSGEAAMRVASMIYNALKGDLTTKGKATLWEFLRSGKDQKLFTIPDEYIKAFTTASKKFGFPFVILKDKSSKTGFTDIMVYATDASKASRVIEKLKLTVKQVETVKRCYPSGARLELIKMDDPQAPPEGTKGTVIGVDDAGDIRVDWDNGSGLNVVYGEDVVKKITERICPRCGRSYSERPALSRKDNLTDICPECGMLEAVEAAKAAGVMI